MKNLLLLSLVILTVVTVCINVGCRGDSQKPTAYIDEISPIEAPLKAVVSFVGHGTDSTSDVVAWRWRSDLDGELSSRQSFTTSSLSEGVHTIYFKVQNERGAWSEEVTGTVQISAVAAIEESSKPVITSFNASPVSIEAGGSSELSWAVSNATDVSIDQGIGPVSLSGTTGVSPTATTVYTMTATNAGGNATASAQVIVTPVPTPSLPTPSPPTPSPPPVAGSPDLVIEDIMYLGSTISYKIKNQGDVDAGPTTSELIVNGLVKASDQVSPLAAGATSTEKFGYQYICSDTADTVTVRADNGAVVAESNEGNNELSKSWSCIADLVALDVWLEGNQIYGQITNQGNALSGNQVVALIIDGSVKATKVLNVQAGIGMSGPFFQPYSYGCIGNNDVVTLVVDYYDWVAESNEGNNEYSETWSCLKIQPYTPIIEP